MNTQDARDILELGASTTSKEPARPRRPPVREKKPDGVNRELYNLIGGLATLPVSEQRARFKERPAFSVKQAHWAWKGFTNSARDDDLVLYHWVNEADDSTDRTFAGYNKVVDVVEYTDEEYAQCLVDADWSKDETDYLFEMCRRFDLRFLVIADRYSFDDKLRTLEDIKERYYNVARRVLRIRNDPAATQTEAYTFDKDREEQRKHILDKLFRRTQQEVEEEEMLMTEMRRIQQQQRRLQRDHEHVMRLLNIREAPSAPASAPTPPATAATTAAAAVRSTVNGGANGAMGTPAPKQKTNGNQRPVPGAGDATDTARRKRKMSRKDSFAGGEAHDVTGKTDATTPARKERWPIGVSLRSSRIPPIRAQNTLTKVLECLRELHVGIRPVMATEQLCQRYEQLRQSTVKMLESKKYADRLDQELRTLRYRYKELANKAAPGSTADLFSDGDDDDHLGDGGVPRTPVQARKRPMGPGSAALSQKRARR